MTTKIIYGGVVIGAILGVLAFVGFSPFTKTIVQQFSSTTQGATGNTARQANIYGVNLATPGANATSSSILNPTGQDVYITAFKAGCTGIGSSNTAYTGSGLAALTVKLATTSTAAPANITNANLIGGAGVIIATSTPQFMIASTTSAGTAAAPGSGAIYGIWTANSYITFQVNATNSAVCTFGVDYFQS